jgi:hypothetical protein
MREYLVYEIDYPETGTIVEADNEDEAKKIYNEMTGSPLPYDSLDVYFWME